MTRRSVGWAQLRHAVIVSLAVLGVGLVGYALILHESPFRALYRTVVVVSGVGLDTVPLSWGAKALTIVLSIAGVAIFVYIVGLVIELTVGGVIGGALEERRLRHRLERLTDHYVICGFGRVGQRVAAEFRAARIPYNVVELAPHQSALARARGELLVEGSATEDGVLAEAGLDRAKGLVACLGSDADNVYVVLTARGARPNLHIAARAAEDDAIEKLRRAGADRIVSPYQTAGRELATMLLKPQVAAFLDVAAGAGAPEFRLEQIEVTPSCASCGRTIRDLRIREVTGALVVAHRRGAGTFDTRPDPDLVLEPGDVLIGVGTDSEIGALEDLFRPTEAVV